MASSIVAGPDRSSYRNISSGDSQHHTSLWLNSRESGSPAVLPVIDQAGRMARPSRFHPMSGVPLPDMVPAAFIAETGGSSGRPVVSSALVSRVAPSDETRPRVTGANRRNT